MKAPMHKPPMAAETCLSASDESPSVAVASMKALKFSLFLAVTVCSSQEHESSQLTLLQWHCITLPSPLGSDRARNDACSTTPYHLD